MKKTILIFLFISVFSFGGSNLFAQTETKASATEKIVSKITKSAVVTIKNNKTLTAVDKQKFIERLNTLSNSVKTDKTMSFEKEYKEIANSYTRITSKSLPAYKTAKSEASSAK